ncbi:MAG: hypothetical protein H6739_02315 [Alphaproteobacteria bacterium]|nr:hypothetical protein [Alphaproteobacteria bacterium]
MRRLFPLLLLLIPLSADAKDLRNRLGVGFQNQFSQMSSISVKYGLPAREPAINIQAELNAGFSVLNGTADAFFLGARLNYALVAEDNMNLYVAAGGGFLQQGELSGVRVQPAAGTEFFLFGLENLGFTAEIGVNLDYLDGFNVGTVSGGPAIGVHYYF